MPGVGSHSVAPSGPDLLGGDYGEPHGHWGSSFIVSGEEVCPSTGLLHYQAYVMFYNQVCLATLIKYFSKGLLGRWSWQSCEAKPNMVVYQYKWKLFSTGSQGIKSLIHYPVTYLCTGWVRFHLTKRLGIHSRRGAPLVMLVRHWPWCTFSESPRLWEINLPRTERIECIEPNMFQYAWLLRKFLECSCFIDILVM